MKYSHDKTEAKKQFKRKKIRLISSELRDGETLEDALSRAMPAIKRIEKQERRFYNVLTRESLIPLGGSIHQTDKNLRRRIARLPKDEIACGVMGSTNPFYEEAFGFDRSTFGLYLRARKWRGGTNPFEGFSDFNWTDAKEHSIWDLVKKSPKIMNPQLFRAYDCIAAHIKLAGWYRGQNTRPIELGVINQNEVLGDKEDCLLEKYATKYSGHENPHQKKYDFVRRMRTLRTMDDIDLSAAVHTEERIRNSHRQAESKIAGYFEDLTAYDLPVYVTEGISECIFNPRIIEVQKRFLQAWSTTARPGTKIPQLMSPSHVQPHEVGGIWDHEWFESKKFIAHAYELIDKRCMTELQYGLLVDVAQVLDRCSVIATFFAPQEKNRAINSAIDRYDNRPVLGVAEVKTQ